MTDEEQDPDSTYSLSPSERKDKPKPIVSPECGAVFSEPARSYPSVDHVSDENRVSPPAPATGLVDGGPSEEEAEDWDRLVTHWSAGDRIQYRVRRLVTLGIWLTILGGGAWGVFAFMGGAFDYVGTPTSQHTANLQKGVLTRINPGMTLPEIRELLGTKGNWLTNLQGHEVKRYVGFKAGRVEQRHTDRFRAVDSVPSHRSPAVRYIDRLSGRQGRRSTGRLGRHVVSHSLGVLDRLAA